ncbi:MAG: TolC family protein [Prolixibacteraceae bacterium]|jgi:outer membrane protein TolC|nr:TolC family protein [Prolixibacteraceae bacterium]
MKKIVLNIGFLLLVSFMAKGQAVSLSLDEAISIGLKNNFSIQIANNDSKIAENNNTLGNAGFLPSLNFNSGAKKNITSTNTEDMQGIKTESPNQQTSNYNMGASLDWTLFNGFGMFIKKEKLESLQVLQQTTTRATIENTVSEIVISYFAIVQLKNLLQVLQNAIDFSNSRYELTRKKLQIGSASELAFLKSSTDLNADSSSFLRQKVALNNAKAKLRAMLVLDATADFEVSSAIQFNQLLDYAGLKENLISANSQLDLAKQTVDLALIDYRLTHAPMYPQVAFFTDYSYNYSKYNWGSMDVYQNKGPVFGLNLSIPVFDGFNKSRVLANARINAESSKLSYQQVLVNLEASLWQIYNEYKNDLKLVTLETANLQVARHTAKISFEKFRVGEMSDYELRQIQLSELEAENSLLTAQFQAKKSETELLRLSGKLIEDKKSK